MTHPPLMLLPPHVLDQCKTGAYSRKRGHPARPGTGPKGETCKTCAHSVCRQMANRYYKCELTRASWTAGPGSDIRLKDPACKFWETKLPAARIADTQPVRAPACEPVE